MKIEFLGNRVDFLDGCEHLKTEMNFRKNNYCKNPFEKLENFKWKIEPQTFNKTSSFSSLLYLLEIEINWALKYLDVPFWNQQIGDENGVVHNFSGIRIFS